MKRLLLCLILFPATALAQQGQPDMVPVTLSPEDIGQMTNTIMDIPTRYGLPLLRFLHEKEAAASAASAAAAAKAVSPPAVTPSGFALPPAAAAALAKAKAQATANKP